MQDTLALNTLLADGDKQLAEGDKTHALERFQSAARLDPRNARAWFGVARATGSRDEAIDALGQVLVLDPQNLEARNLRLSLQVNGLREGIHAEEQDPEHPLKRWVIPILLVLVILVWLVAAWLARDYIVQWMT